MKHIWHSSGGNHASRGIFQNDLCQNKGGQVPAIFNLEKIDQLAFRWMKLIDYLSLGLETCLIGPGKLAAVHT